ncbi:hypothetical protein NKJ59_06195 [Mesorhizobium australicum]|uniref:hypothetical protein n=1 Tax=Mesorhizobium australicum TaxID=536018 RepID=UPI00333E0EFC
MMPATFVGPAADRDHGPWAERPLDGPASARDKLIHATSLGGVLQQLSVSLGVSVAAMLLGLIAGKATS